MRDHHGAHDYVFDQCQYGLAYRKATQLLTDAEMTTMSNRCTHPPGHHTAMKGKDLGVFKTTKQSQYPSELRQALAAAYLQHRIRVETRSPELQRRSPSESVANIQAHAEFSRAKAESDVANPARHPCEGTLTEGEVGAHSLAVAAVAVLVSDDEFPL